MKISPPNSQSFLSGFFILLALVVIHHSYFGTTFLFKTGVLPSLCSVHTSLFPPSGLIHPTFNHYNSKAVAGATAWWYGRQDPLKTFGLQPILAEKRLGSGIRIRLLPRLEAAKKLPPVDIERDEKLPDYEYTIANGYIDWPLPQEKRPMSIRHKLLGINKARFTRNERKLAMIEEYKPLRRRYKHKIKEARTKNEHKYYQILLDMLPRDSCPSRFKLRCIASGRARSVKPFFGLCRHEVRRMFKEGKLPGVQEAIW